MEAINTALLHAWRIFSSGKNKEITLSDVEQEEQGSVFTWIHLDINHKDCQKILREMNAVNEVTEEALLAAETRPRSEELESGTLVILRGINHNNPDEPEDMISVRMWIQQDLVITAQRRNLLSVKDVDEHLRSGNSFKGPGELLTMLISRLTYRMESTFAQLDERMDKIEESIVSSPSQEIQQQLSAIRKEAIIFRRYISPQREAVSRLSIFPQAWLSKKSRQELQVDADNLIRFVENLDTIRERAQILKDELTNLLSYKMNRNLYLLSIVTAIFLPLGMLTGLFGINLAGMPGASNESAFYLFSVCLTLIVVVQVIVFRKMKLF